jgi:peroxidase
VVILKGCDASILISTTPGSKVLAEKDAEDNQDLRVEGFQTISKAKALVESKCPGVVSSADILAIAARDYVHLVCASFSFLNIILIMPFHFGLCS